MPTAPYDSLITVINAVNIRLGADVNTLTSIGGQILGNTNAWSQQATNTAWRKMQQYLASQGYVRLTVPGFLIPNVPPVANEDTATQVTFDWTGYFDGVTLYPTLALPQDFIRPTAMAERPTDDAPNVAAFIDIDLQNIGRVPFIPKQPWNQIAVWNDDNISMPGALVYTDIRVDYVAFLSDFLDTGNTTTTGGYVRWFNQSVPIMRALEPLTNYICAEVERARGNVPAVLGYTQAGESGAMSAIIGKAAN